MARPLRFQYPGAVYHVMARGDGGRTVFETDDDRNAFLSRLGEVCGSHGWRVHAWVLMGNHFHLLLETPQPNLVSGMKWLLGTFSQGWNRARQRRGHVFQGRYRSVPVTGGEADAFYFRIAADYIHLNPARAGLAGGERGSLAVYPWSSLKNYAKGKGPTWLRVDRVLRAFELAQDGRGRRAYVEWLEARARDDEGNLSPEAMAALKRGWYLGKESFRDRLLKLVEKPVARRQGSLSGEAARDRSLKEAERLVKQGAKRVGLPAGPVGLGRLKKSDRRKVLLAMLLRRHTVAENGWVAQRLGMGAPGAVSRLVGDAKRDKEMLRELKELEKELGCVE